MPRPTTTWAASLHQLRIGSTGPGQFEQARSRSTPNNAEAHANLGNVLLHQCKIDEAAARYEQALALQPDFRRRRIGPGHLLSGRRRLRAWLAACEGAAAPARVCAAAQPAALDGRTLGRPQPAVGGRARLGRYAPIRPLRPAAQGAGRAGRAGGQPALGRLLAPDPDVGRVVLFLVPARIAALRLLSSADECSGRARHRLPRRFPGDVPYLAADTELTDAGGGNWRRIEGFKIGIVWQGSRVYRPDRWRSIPLAQFAPLARLPGVRLISLQKGFGSEQIAAVDFPVVDLSDRLDEAAGPFMDTAAVIGKLDLVVASDTAIAHLAGALGAPVWVALPFSPDWRWLRDRDDSPWYPTMRLFRQTTFGPMGRRFRAHCQPPSKRRRAEAGRDRGHKRMTTASPRVATGRPVAQARREHRAGRLAEAAAAYRQILAMRPDVAEVHNKLGILLCAAGAVRPGRWPSLGCRQSGGSQPDYRRRAFNNLGA